MKETNLSAERLQWMDNFNIGMAAIGSMAIIVGALLPWVAHTDFSDLFSDAVSDRSGVGFWGLGFGTITFIQGWMIFGGVFGFTFGIPRNIYLAALGLSTYCLTLGYTFILKPVNQNADFGVGTWVSLGGASLMLTIISSTFFNRRDLAFGSKTHFKKESLPFINALLAVGIGVGVNFPFASELGRNFSGDGGSPREVFEISNHYGALIVALLAVPLIITLVGQMTSKNPPAALFFIFTLPLLSVSSVFIVGIFLSSIFTPSLVVPLTSYGGGAANWVVFTSALLVTAASYRKLILENREAPDEN